MSIPTRGSNTNTAQIHVTWTALSSPANGDSAITTYALYWDSGSGTSSYTALVGLISDYLLNEYTVTENINSG